MLQTTRLPDLPRETLPRSRGQLLKWVGNKQRYAPEIVRSFPRSFGTYFEPFLGSGAVLAHLRPERAVGADTFGPLIGIWQALRQEPETLKRWYAERYELMREGPERVAGYETVKASYNRAPNAADLLFLCRSCYGGVVRFRKSDGYMSTPCGIHQPMRPETFGERVDDWHERTRGAEFVLCDYREAFARAVAGDLIYCDPPYSHSQAILYGAQGFSLEQLFEEVARAKARGVRVVISIDGTKKSGALACELPIPPGLFAQERLIDCGRSMLKRFQMVGRTLEEEGVKDRLLLTY